MPRLTESGGYPCLYCSCSRTKVLETRTQHRRRVCLECATRFSTVELPADMLQAMKQEIARLLAVEQRHKEEQHEARDTANA